MYSALGTLYRRLGDARAADQNYGFALRYERDHPESLLGRALLALDSDSAGGLPTAATSLKKLLDADPPPSPRQLAVAHLARALLVARVQVAMSGLSPADARKLAEATGVPLDRAAAAALAAKEDEEGFALDRNNPELHLLRGKRLLVEGQPDAAIREMREAVKADPSRAQAYVDLARALMQKPEGARDAQEALTTAIRTMGESPRLMVMLGQVYFRQGRLDDAAAQYTKALADGKSKNPEARLQLGVVYREKKDYPQSRRAAHAGRARSSSGSPRASPRRSPSWAAPTRPRATAPGPTRPTAGRWTPTRATPTPTSSTPGSSAQTGAAGRRPASPRRSTSSSSPRGEHAADAQALAR